MVRKKNGGGDDDDGGGGDEDEIVIVLEVRVVNHCGCCYCPWLCGWWQRGHFCESFWSCCFYYYETDGAHCCCWVNRWSIRKSPRLWWIHFYRENDDWKSAAVVVDARAKSRWWFDSVVRRPFQKYCVSNCCWKFDWRTIQMHFELVARMLLLRQ